MICQTCGADLGDRAPKFCLQCGAPLAGESAQPDVPAENEASAQAAAPDEDAIPTVVFWPSDTSPAQANTSEAESEPVSPDADADNAAARWVKKYATELAVWAETAKQKHSQPETSAEFEPTAPGHPFALKRIITPNTRAIAIGTALLVLIAGGILAAVFRQPADTALSAPPVAADTVATIAPETASVPVQAVPPDTNGLAAENDADLTLEAAPEPETSLDTIPMLPANQLGKHNRPHTPTPEPPQTSGETEDIMPSAVAPSVAVIGQTEDSSLPAFDGGESPEYAKYDDGRIESKAAPKPPPPIVQERSAPAAERSSASVRPPTSKRTPDKSSSPAKAPVRTATPIPVSRLKSLPMPLPSPTRDHPDPSPPRTVPAGNPIAQTHSAPTATTRKPPQSRQPPWLNRMHGELSNCDDFFCRERVRNRYCSERWDHLPECKGSPL